MAPVLGYWNLRGLAQPIRLLLAYTDEEYEDKLYTFAPAPEYKASWYKEKFTLGLPLPNLPYYIDGDIKVTQSNAIMRHIARKHGLDGKSEAEKVRVDTLENEATGLRTAYADLVYQHYPTKGQEYFNKFRDTLKTLSDYLGEQTWFTGDHITMVDFILYELFDVHRIQDAAILDHVPNLKTYMKRFEDLPAIKKYMSSSKFIAKPLNGSWAYIGGQ